MERYDKRRSKEDEAALNTSLSQGASKRWPILWQGLILAVPKHELVLGQS
jgi:hypothetical protein